MAGGQKSDVLNGLIERRFGFRLDAACPEHLRDVAEHYQDKRRLLLWQLGEADALKHPDYAKAVLVSEAASTMLREIAPRRRKRTKRNGHK
jgi:hypothetical protein